MENEVSILVVEDDAKLGHTIQHELEMNGFHTDLAIDSRIAETRFSAGKYDLVLMDINLPFLNGWELCRRFREKDRKVPIIMLTALGEIQDKMDAFNQGADDYVVKPFHFKELIARIRVFLKRQDQHLLIDEILTNADLSMDLSHKTVTRAGTDISLTAKEFALLELLMKAKGRIISKSEIGEKIWNSNFETGTNTIEVYINFLRNKIDKPFGKALIHTKAGFGYYLKASDEH